MASFDHCKERLFPFYRWRNRASESLGLAPGKWRGRDLKLEVSDPNPPGSQGTLNFRVRRQAGPKPPKRPLPTHRSAEPGLTSCGIRE